MLDKLKELVTGQAPIKECLGVYISPEAVFLCEAVYHGGRNVKIVQSATVPLPPDMGTAKMGTLNTDLLEKIDKLAELIRTVLSQGQWPSKKVVFSLSPHFGLTRYFLMPEIAKKFHKQSVPLEAKKYIPFPFAELMYDFQAVPVPPGPDKKGRMGVLFAIMPQKNVANLRLLADKIGRELAAVELSTVSAGRLWQNLLAGPGGDAAQAEVVFDSRATYVVVHRSGVPILSREVYWNPGQEIDKRRIDVNGCVDFVKKQLGVTAVKIRVMGSGPLQDWQKTFQEDFNAPVDAADLAGAAGLQDKSWGSMAALGTALRFVLPAGSPIDISQSAEKSQRDSRVIFNLWLTSGALSMVFLALGILNQLQVVWTLGQLEAVNRQSGDIPAFKDKSADQIQGIMGELQGQVAALGAVVGPRKPAAEVLAWIVDNIPETVWLTDVAYENRFAGGKGPGGGAGGGTNMAIKGMVAAGGATEQIQTINLFRDSLKKDKRFLKFFSAIDFEADRSSEVGQVGTLFTLKCRGKGG